ncbi:hypothetical protein [Mesorhizobium caraganae]|uniref:hypothetical protein n=1 Tax=Mesorhizobium caraganae TaxID=483206 RepID=UPI0017855EC9|nr:hypothetical protein [Mesorhizobium caraganae]
MAEPNPTPGVDSIAAPRGAKQWLDEIQQAEKDLARWTKRVKKIERIWLEDRDEADNLKRQYALLWANVSVLQPSVYAKQPLPVVTRRFSDRDPVARNVSEVLERSLVTLFDHADINSCMMGVRDNFLVVGQGTAWVRYVPSFKTKQFGEESVDALSDETLAFDFVHWSDFLRPKARCWEDLPWIGRRVYPDEAAGISRFGKEKWDKVKAATEAKSDRSKGPKDQPCVYEIWSKRDKMVYWVAKGFEDEFLDEKPPLYELRGFYPCPRPAWATKPTDSLEPIPDYVYYQDQAEEVNKLTAKIGALEDALKLVGFYPGGAEGGISSAIESALMGDVQNKMIPIPSWAAFVQGGGSKQMIEWLPVEQVMKVLQGCVELRKQLIDDVFQITGISDIIRGQGVASETATAQNIKAQWGGIRIRDRQTELARFARDLTRIAAEIVAEKFQPETLWRLSGLKFPSAQEKQALQAQVQQQMAALQAQQQAPQQPGQPPQPQTQPKPPELPQQVKDTLEIPSQEDLIQLMKDDGLRSYRIDIETDSTIAADEQAEKESRQEFVTVLGGMLAQSLPIAQQVPELVPVIGESLLFLTRAYRTGRQLEDTIENAVAAITAKASQSQNQPPPPDPASEKIKADAEASKAKLALQAEETKAKLQNDQQETAARLQMDKQAQDAEIENERIKIAADHQTKQAQIAMSAAPQQDDVSAKLDALMNGMQQLQQIVATLLPPPSMPQNGLAQ